jgi:hypothetical protein
MDEIKMDLEVLRFRLVPVVENGTFQHQEV